MRTGFFIGALFILASCGGGMNWQEYEFNQEVTQCKSGALSGFAPTSAQSRQAEVYCTCFYNKMQGLHPDYQAYSLNKASFLSQFYADRNEESCLEDARSTQ